MRIQRFATREEAEAAEAAAIRDERPRHNITGTGTAAIQARPIHQARRLHRLSARGVETANNPGRYADGGGLYLQITKAGGKSWVFRFQRDGRETSLGLGAVRNVPLATAREKARIERERLGAAS